VDGPSREAESFRELEDGTILVGRGPMLMSIFVSNGRTANRPLAREGARKALEVLETLASFRKLITQNIRKIVSIERLPSIVKRMVSAARRFEDPTVTPLICVAGAGADEVADFIFNTGEPSKVIVNNGGDIAIRLNNKEIVTVGIKTDLREKAVTHTLTVTPASGIGGVATSGFGGRSLTRGIANAAVAVAKDATLADVAATLVGNATDVESPAVVKVLAKEMYEATDIPDLWVTKSIGRLERSRVEEALDRGMQKAEIFREMGLISGAFLAIKDRYRISNSIISIIQSLPTP
jgi:ApbE superfamily uncharacterized protein (UPF0280 family)